MFCRISPNRTAFFLCDIQEKFRPLIYRFQDVVTTSQKMVAAGKVLSVPLIVTEQYPRAFGNIVKEIDVEHAAIREAKTKFSMCIPEVNAYLARNEITSAVLWGLESHVCVTQTALDLLQRNIAVYLLADGISSINSMEIPIALKRLSQSGAVVTSSESLLFQLMSDSKHEDFKSISAIVKEHTELTKENQLFQFISHKL